MLGLLVIPAWILTHRRRRARRQAARRPPVPRGDPGRRGRAVPDRRTGWRRRSSVSGCCSRSPPACSSTRALGRRTSSASATCRYAVAAAVLLGTLQLIPELGFFLGFFPLLIPLAIGGPEAAVAFALVYIGSVKARVDAARRPGCAAASSTSTPACSSRPSWSSASSASSGCFAAAPVVAIVRDLVRYANARLADPPGPAGVLPGEKVRSARTSSRAGNPVPSVYRAPAPPAPAARPASASASSPTRHSPRCRRPPCRRGIHGASRRAFPGRPAGTRRPPGPWPSPRPGRLCRRPAQDRARPPAASQRSTQP